MTSFGFNVGDTDPSTSFDPIPPGWYTMAIVRCEPTVSQNNPAAGQMCKVEFEVDANTHPDFAGRRVWTYLCHQHEKRQVRDIAQRQIAAIAQAIGKPNAAEMEDFLGGELQVKVSVRPASGNYDASNEAKGFRAVGEGDAGSNVGDGDQTSKRPPWGGR